MTEKKCLKCGKQLKAGDKFCPSCGQPIDREAGPLKKTRSDHYIIIGILVVVALIYVGYLAFSPDKTNPHTESSESPQPMGMPVDVESFVENLPTEFSSLVSMGNALMDQGRFELAIECYSRALLQKPEETNILVDLGTCQHSLGMSQDAIVNFKKALEHDPGHQVAKFNLGIVYSSLGNNDEALKWFKKLLSENPAPELKDRAGQLIKQIEK